MRIDISDVTVVIPLRVDSEERLANINTLIGYLKAYTSAPIIVFEVDTVQKGVGLDRLDITYRFIKDDTFVFHHTRYRNEMIKTCLTPIIAVWDVDAIVPMPQLLEAVEKIRTGEAAVTWPFNGVFYHVPAELGEIFKKILDIELLTSHRHELSPMFGGFSTGGVFLADRINYMEVGMENEFIYGWGPEDFERLRRITMLGLPAYRVKGGLYHLWHPRGINYFNHDTERELRNFREYFKVCQYTRIELLNYIKTWKWIIN